MLVSSHDLFHGLAPASALAAFNVITVEHAEAIAEAAERTGRPAILQLSENAIRFHGRAEPIAAAMVAVARSSSAALALHLDHITDVDLALRTRELGFSSVMFDGAGEEFARNVELTAHVARWGRENDVWVEAELGKVGGKDGAHTPGVRTDPAEAAEFVRQTGVDSLAVAVGSSHAMATKTAQLDIELIRSLADAVPVPLVLHGSSGVSDENIADAVAAGMRKINIGTALNVAFTGEVRTWIAANDGNDPRKYLAPARAAMSDLVADALTVVSGAR